MPGPVSDGYDPEFGTGDNADAVRQALQNIVNEITKNLGMDLVNIVKVARQDGAGPGLSQTYTEKGQRLIRFGLLRALESL